MIVFKTIRFKNFLSTGNAFTEISLNKHKAVLVAGNNGSGKSTFLDAICYSLYGAPYRNINRPQLINSINNKHCLVEVEFSIGNTEYMVRRGQKPNVFEIYQNGKMINQSAEIRDYQRMLENNILKMNEKSFRQTVVIGSADYVPFMKLPAADRRRVIEDILDIQAFSQMNALLKQRIDANERELEDVNHALDVQQKLAEQRRKHLEEMRQDNEAIIAAKKAKINEYNESIDAYNNEIESLQLSKQALEESLSPSIEKACQDALALEAKIARAIAKVEKEILFYQEHDHCPTCRQGIGDIFRDTSISTLRGKRSEYESKRESLAVKLSKLHTRLTAHKDTEKQIQSITTKLVDLSFKVNTNHKFIKNIESEIKEIRQRNKTAYGDKFAATESSDDLKSKRKILLEQRQSYGFAHTLLKDTGIKARIIKQYVPVMNQLINEYLKKTEFFIEFELDETFKETILSRGRDNFTYGSFSEGEKMRIDLSILFTWREIAKIKRSSSANLLILDEIFDSPLDDTGMEDFINMIHALSPDTNTFIVSPKANAISDKFDNIIRFVKIKNFSKMSE